MPTTDDLMQDVYAILLGAYSGPSADQAVVAFEPFGVMPGIDPKSPGAAPTALEFLSVNADVVPDLSGHVYAPTERTISQTYAVLLAAAQPSAATQADAFATLKAAANERLANGAAGSELGVYRYYPAFASPPAWYDAAAPDIWTHYAYAAAPPATPPSANPPPATPPSATPLPVRPPIRPPVRMLVAPVWHLATAPVAAGHALLPAAKPAMASPAPAVTALHSALLIRRPIDPVHILLRPPPPPDGNDALHPSFTLQFDYCVVQLQRPWLSGDFLSTPDWNVPGAHAGEVSSGTAPAKGPLAVLPSACIVVKNLVITAIDTLGATSDATAFGPFALRPNAAGSAASSRSNSLTNPGVQIIGWVCTPQPKLPPNTDPALIPPIEAQNVASILMPPTGAVEQTAS